MGKNKHEIRDVIHSFVYYDDRERAVIDSPPYQRLRDINQLGFAHFVYPGARHTRFEHSIGVMHLADRIYNTVTDSNNIALEAKEKFFKELGEQRDYWRKVVKLSALCHDIGHLPYSHTAERVLFPNGINHETILNDLLRQEHISHLFDIVPPVKADDVVKLALGPEKAKTPFTEWELLLSEIIVGDAFGADRIDYLLRDSYHLGVPYGHFDHHRLIDSLRILKLPAVDDKSEEQISKVFEIGVDSGGMRTVEGMLLARYHMYSQVYYHEKVKAYELLLIDFMKEIFEGLNLGDPDIFLKYSDSEVYSKLYSACRDIKAQGHERASRILTRRHFRVLYKHNKSDVDKNPKAFELVWDALAKQFPKEKLGKIDEPPKEKDLRFIVQKSDKSVKYAFEESDILTSIPTPGLQCVYFEPETFREAEDWLNSNLDNILRTSLDESPKKVKEAQDEQS